MSDGYQTGQSSDSTTQAAKAEASGLAHSAAESGSQLAGAAKAQAGEVGREAGRQAKSVLQQGRTQLVDQASQQQSKAAGSIRTLSEELQNMASAPEAPGFASDLVNQAAGRVESIASWLESREPADLVEEIKTYARRHPGTFLAIAAGAGLLAGRLTRGLKDAASADAELETSYGAHRAPGIATATAPERTSVYGSTYGTGTTYGETSSVGTGAAYAAGLGASTEAPLTGTAGGTPTYGVEEGGYAASTTGGSDYDRLEPGTYGTGSAYSTTGSADDTVAYSTGDTAAYGETPAPTYGEGTYGQDTYGTGTENPPAEGATYDDTAGQFGGGTTEVPEHEQTLSWPPVHGEGEQR